jgi:hypothetical protein
LSSKLPSSIHNSLLGHPLCLSRLVAEKERDLLRNDTYPIHKIFDSLTNRKKINPSSVGNSVITPSKLVTALITKKANIMHTELNGG